MNKMDVLDKNFIPFTVSARTARLIGRENIATSKGAIIELVKNSYDADSPLSVVYFDNKFSSVPNKIDENLFQDLVCKGIPKDLIEKLYERTEDGYQLASTAQEEDINELKKSIAPFTSLYIIDFGEGMTQKIIREHWMTIGTDNKAYDIFTKTGRVKAGAKGIGRFALDKLGGRCEMVTIFNPEYHSDVDVNGIQTGYAGYVWEVNWEDFEGEFKTIDKVGAKLSGIHSVNLKEELLRLLPDFPLSEIKVSPDFKYGTILKITNLRDNWEDYFVEQVFSDLEVLVPPKESNIFDIFVFSSLCPKKYGEVLGSVCDDFDYKLVASADEDQNVKIRIYRNEYDLELIPHDFFLREGMQKDYYTKNDFLRGYWERTITFAQLLKGFKGIDTENILGNIGVFDFTFYYLKRQTDSINSQKYFNKNFMGNARKEWLSKFGGIKLFRDNFRVRPYGEVKDVAFDWLGLGTRKAASPAGIGKKDGGYRVEPENVAGAIKISRLTNVDFEDKSSREGLQENKTFQVFKNLIAEIINVFEEDRAYIAREMSDYDDIRFGGERDREKANQLTKDILAKSRERRKAKEEGYSQEPLKEINNDNEADAEKEILANEIERKEEEIEQLREEQKLLRGLASSGIVLASFSHDLSKLNDVLDSRTDKLVSVISQKFSGADYDAEDRKNPFKLIERIKKQDIKLQNWLNFSIGATRKDKRKRKQLFLRSYFTDLSNDWRTVFEDRAITMNTSGVDDLDMRVFEIDFDSIFNNLIVNSIDAFIISKANRERVIAINAICTKEIMIEYHDNGPGLSPDIDEPENIFKPMYTTRRNRNTGEEEGTGLGMWLVKSIVEENDGKVELLYPDIGFGIRMKFPVKYKK